MCGRYALTLPPEAVRAFFGYEEQPNFPPRYNIAPTQPIAIVVAERRSSGATTRHFRLVRWGFVPSFIKDFSAFRPIINARSEQIAEKPSFRAALRRRRCLVVADAFYEWQQRGREPSQPYLIQRHDKQPIGLAGLYETWLGADGSELEGACILTTSSNGLLAGIHSRMPVIIPDEASASWLDPDELQAEKAYPLMRPAAEGMLEAVPVGPGVNAVSNDNPAVQQPIATPPRPGPAPEAWQQGCLF